MQNDKLGNLLHHKQHKKTQSGKIYTNKCVSRTDTNPPFAFDIAFSGKVSRGFYRGYRDG